jgi:hypothetical protein
MELVKYSGNEVCAKCGGTTFSLTRHGVEDRCPLEAAEHIHLTCGKCGMAHAVGPMDQQPI